MLTTLRRAWLASLSLASVAVLLAACSEGQGPADGAGSPVPSSEAVATAAAVETTETVTEPTESQTSLPTHRVGEVIELPSATLTVKVLEQRSEVASSDPGFTPNFTPAAGERLWYFEIEWTNLTSAVVDKECHGPDAVNLSVFDINGNEMQEVDQPGFIEGNDCSTGLRNGQTGTWRTAYLGDDVDFGYADFMDLTTGDEGFVVLSPWVQLS